jgi:hypothetical protein
LYLSFSQFQLTANTLQRGERQGDLDQPLPGTNFNTVERRDPPMCNALIAQNGMKIARELALSTYSVENSMCRSGQKFKRLLKG